VVGSNRHKKDGWSPGSNEQPVGNKQQVEFAALGNAGDLLRYRQIEIADCRAP
jgi:hypothetical protein